MEGVGGEDGGPGVDPLLPSSLKIVESVGKVSLAPTLITKTGVWGLDLPGRAY